MNSVVSFPGLGIEVNISRVAFTLFGIEFYWYGVLIAVGALLAIWYSYRRVKDFGIDWDNAVNVVLVATISSIIGARLYYVIFAEKGEFTSFLEILDIRRGGVAFYGAVIGGFVAAAIACRYNKIKIRPFFDLAGIGFLIGQGIGRWGNFINQEAFGSNTSLPWGMTSDNISFYLITSQETLQTHGMRVDPVMPVHPTFLYESLWCLLGFILLTLHIRKRKFDGELFLMFIAWNGAGRGFIEALRTDSLYIGSIRVSQLLAIACSILAIGAILYIRLIIKKERKEDPDFMIPYGHTEQCELDMQELLKKREIQKEEYEKKKQLKKAKKGFQDDTEVDESGLSEDNEDEGNESEAMPEEEKKSFPFTIEEIE